MEAITRGSDANEFLRITYIAEFNHKFAIPDSPVDDWFVAARDRHGFRPLCLGRLNEASLSVPRHARSMLLELATFVRSSLARFELIEVLSIVDLDKKDLDDVIPNGPNL